MSVCGSCSGRRRRRSDLNEGGEQLLDLGFGGVLLDEFVVHETCFADRQN
jgi:hypothetical protein